MPIKRFGAACVLTSLALSPALADEFCDRLKTIIASSSGNFQAVSGKPDDVFPTTPATVKLPGSDDCEIDAASEENRVSYFCTWPKRDDEAATTADYAQVVERVGACVGGGGRQEGAARTVWSMPRAWKITATHRKITPSKPSRLVVVVEKN